MTYIREGGCLCGNARYRMNIENAEVGNCHCTICRKHSGAPYATFISVKDNQFTWLSEPSGYIQTGKDSGRYFCKQCGTPLRFVSEKYPNMMDITLATFDDPSGLLPTYEIFNCSRMEGVPVVGGAKQFEQDN